MPVRTVRLTFDETDDGYELIAVEVKPPLGTKSAKKKSSHIWNRSESNVRHGTKAMLAFVWLLAREAGRGKTNPRAQAESINATKATIGRSILTNLRKQSPPRWASEVFGDEHPCQLVQQVGRGATAEVQLRPDFCAPKKISLWLRREGSLVEANPEEIAESLRSTLDSKQGGRQKPTDYFALVQDRAAQEELAELGRTSIEVYSEDVIDRREAMLIGVARQVQIYRILGKWIERKEDSLKSLEDEAEYENPDDLNHLAEEVEYQCRVTREVVNSVLSNIGDAWEPMKQSLTHLEKKFRELERKASPGLANGDSRGPRVATSGASAATIAHESAEVLKACRDCRTEWRKSSRAKERLLDDMLLISRKRWRQAGSA